MPFGAIPLHVASVNDVVCLWVQVKPEAMKVMRAGQITADVVRVTEEGGESLYTSDRRLYVVG